MVWADSPLLDLVTLEKTYYKLILFTKSCFAKLKRNDKSSMDTLRETLNICMYLVQLVFFVGLS